MYIVYKHTAPNKKCYIGVTCNDIEKRANKGRNYRCNKHFYNAIQKYGWDNIKHEVLIDGLTKQEAESLEIKIIAYYDSANPKKGYNISPGGGLAAESTRRKMSENARKRCNGETFYRGAGENNPFYGRTHSAETRKKLSELAKTHNLGGDNPNAKKVICLDTLKVYDCITDASERTGIHRTDINNCCIKERLTAGGLHWAYYDDSVDYTDAARKIEDGRRTKELKVKCIETGEIYKSVKDAAASINRVPSALSICLKGKTETCGGMHWTFI